MLRPPVSIRIRVFLGAVLLSAAVAQGQSILYVDVDAPPGGTGSSWETAFNDLQDALAEAAGSGGTVTEIRVAEGTYRPAGPEGDRTATFGLLDGVALKGGYAGFGEPDPDERDIELHETVLSGDLDDNDGPNFGNNDENSYHVVTSIDTNETAVLDGFTVTAGNADAGVQSGHTDGAGMWISGSPTVASCTFTRNSASDYWASSGTCANALAQGGGVYNAGGSPTLTNCTFIENSVSGTICAFGGGMNSTGGNPTLSNCVFADNSATIAPFPRGGGMYTSEGSTATLTECTFSGNWSDRKGGGMYSIYSNPTLTGCTFSGNWSEYGGAMYLLYDSSTLIDCAFVGNSAYRRGGAMYLRDDSSTLSDCTFTGNWAMGTVGTGGAAYLVDSTATLGNCTFSHNSASEGGAIRSIDGSPALTDCTFTANWASAGGGFSGGGNAALTNCTFRENRVTSQGGGLRIGSTGTQTLKNCTLVGNWAQYGGGLYDYGSPTLIGCKLIGNLALVYGGGIRNEGSPNLVNCIVSGNRALRMGGGMYHTGSSSPTLTNCTLLGNSAGEGGGIFNPSSSANLAVNNCIIWANSGGQLSGTMQVRYSSIQGGWDGVGNVDVDPRFVNAGGLDGIEGTEDDNLRLSGGSPCVDAADNEAVPEDVTTDLDGNPRFVDDPTADDTGNGTPPIVDMGPYEYQEDCNANGIIDTADIADGTSSDCNGNLIPDECEPDCNDNGIADECDIADGTSEDCTGNGIPDECEPDCNINGIADSCDIADGTSEDCNENGVPDACDIAGGTSPDDDGDGIPDECGPPRRIFVDAAATGANDGTSWENAFNDLQDALADAEIPGISGAEIWVAGGTYKPAAPTGLRSATFQLLNSVPAYGGFAGWETTLDERDPNINVTTLSGDLRGDNGPGFSNNSENTYHVVTGSWTDETAILDGFTISGGNANGSDFPEPENCGGGMLNRAGSPTVRNCVFTLNSGTHCAGVHNEFSRATISDCVFTNNSVEGSGGGMCNSESLSTVTDCTFMLNAAAKGGGMYDKSGGPTVANCTFIENSASGPGGGVMTSGSSTTLIGCRFVRNTGEDGGGMFMRFSRGKPTLVSCDFVGNLATVDGGALHIRVRPDLVNCALRGNSASGRGGAIYCEPDGGYGPHPVLTNCTISGNSAMETGGVFNDFSDPGYPNTVDLTLTNCILWGNTDDNGAGEDAQIHLEDGTAFVDYTCVQGWTGLWGGVGNMGLDPSFVDPDGPDGIPGTEDDNPRLSAGSPCIDAADNDAVPPDTEDLDGDSDTHELLPLDLDGHPRFVDYASAPDMGNGTPPIVDMGTYEFQGDCNENGSRDVDDVTAGTSQDCNANWVPDECEVAPLCPACPDCNRNEVPDHCEIPPICPTCPDCNVNEVPDECEIPPICPTCPDCNENGIPDDCETDCQPNGVPDDCDIAAGTSNDMDGNGIPDECDIVPLVAEDSLGVSCTSDGECQNAAVCINGVCYVPKNRYLSIAANPGNAGLLTARRVSLETTGVGTIILGWVGPPNGNAIAYLQEEPEYRDWSLDESVIHVTECEIAPGETYLVQAILEGPSVGDESNYTAPLALPTAPVWGDVVSACPYDVCEPPQGDPFTQPNIDDVLALVNAFQGVENAPLTWLDVDPVVGNGCPEGTITIGDVLVVVNAFTGQPYPGDGPVDCP